ncbi:hypothetical protein N7527_003884 [Penicillium freii]|nr:hypothetical protein N7527_003884 [Penicillium freii]
MPPATTLGVLGSRFPRWQCPVDMHSVPRFQNKCPEHSKYFRLNEMLQDHQEYDDMIPEMTHRLNARDEWHKCIIKKVFDEARRAYTDEYSESEEEPSDEMDDPFWLLSIDYSELLLPKNWEASLGPVTTYIVAKPNLANT